MGIQVEYNPDLALRIFRTPEREAEECLPENLIIGQQYSFLKKDQRNYWLDGEIPLLITQGEQRLSRPIASIQILKATHFKDRDDQIWTGGIYLVHEVYDPANPEIHFEGFAKIK